MSKCFICNRETELGIMDKNKNIKCIKCAVLDEKPGGKKELKADIVICKQNIDQYNKALNSEDISVLIRPRIERALKNERWKLNILEFVVGAV